MEYLTKIASLMCTMKVKSKAYKNPSRMTALILTRARNKKSSLKQFKILNF